MSNVSWDPDQDIEAPTDDVLEQHQLLRGESDEEAADQGFELPIEANEADAVEQHTEAEDEDEDEDDYR